MNQNHYFLEKSMEQHNESMERAASTGWWWSRKSAKSKDSDTLHLNAPAAHNKASCTGKEHGVCCQAYAPCQA